MYKLIIEKKAFYEKKETVKYFYYFFDIFKYIVIFFSKFYLFICNILIQIKKYYNLFIDSKYGLSL
jgi:hypothetical protein